MPETVTDNKDNSEWQEPETQNNSEYKIAGSLTEKSEDPYKNMTEEQIGLLKDIKDAISMSGLLNNSGLPKEKQDELYQLAKNTALDLQKNSKYDSEDIVKQTEKYISEKIKYELKN